MVAKKNILLAKDFKYRECPMCERPVPLNILGKPASHATYSKVRERLFICPQENWTNTRDQYLNFGALTDREVNVGKEAYTAEEVEEQAAQIIEKDFS